MGQNRKKIYWLVFLFSIPFALAHYVNSSFISSFVGEKFIGFLYFLGSLGSILALALAPKIFQKIGGYKFLLLTTILNAFYFLLIANVKSAWGVVIIFILGFSLNILIAFILDEFLKILTKNNLMGRVRGIQIVVTHVAFILVLLSFWLFLGSHPFRIIYVASFFVTMLFLLVLIFSLKNVPEPEYDKVSSVKFVRIFFREKTLAKAYVISLFLQIFYSWMIIYTPLYLSRHLGFTWNQIGIMFAIMLLPFLLIPARVGKYGDRFGERKILMVGFTVASLASLFIFFWTSLGVVGWTILLLATRVGAAMIEVASDTYFFKHIKPENDEYVGVFRSASPLSYILGPLLASLVFFFVPSFNFLYLFLSAIMLYGVYLSSTIKKSDI
ncbi:MAG: MFS transporter [Patescibacteria group bacterium]